MKISFDFDSTLSEPYVQEICKSFNKLDNTIYIITSRTKYVGIFEHSDLYEIARKLGISKENIHFTNGSMKLSKLEEFDIDIHFDDMEDEIDDINRNSIKVKGILVGFDISKLKYLMNNT